MLMPRKNYSLFDDLFRDDFFDKKMPTLMKTDIKELKDKYQLEVDLPGYKKENINIELEEGYLRISAKVEEKKDDEESNYLHKERYYGECTRSFYVGEDIKEEEISAEFTDGILKIDIPKKEEEETVPEKKQIEIK
jgi:HSP20 family molecular chaperone IbpA